jgi:hypothetical protein
MAYEKNVWNTGDLISSEKMNHIETGIADIEANITTQATTAAQNVVKGNIETGSVNTTGKITLTDPSSWHTQHQIRTISRTNYYDMATNRGYPNTLTFCADAFAFARGWTVEQEAQNDGNNPAGEIADYGYPAFGASFDDLQELFRIIPYVTRLINFMESDHSGSGSGGTEEPPAEVEVDPDPGTGGNGGSEVEPVEVVDDPADPGAEGAGDDPNAVPAEVEVPANP